MYVETPVYHDFSLVWNGENTTEVIEAVGEWASAVFQDPTFPQYITRDMEQAANHLVLMHPGAPLLASIILNEKIRFTYKKGVPWGNAPITSSSDETIAANFDEVE